MLFTLIRNEFRKIVRRPKTWVVFALGVLLTVIMVFANYKSDKNMRMWMSPEYQIEMYKDNLNYVNKEIEGLEKNDENKETINMFLADKEYYEEEIKKYEEMIKNGLVEETWKAELDSEIADRESYLKDFESSGVSEADQGYYLNEKQKLEELKYLKDNNIKPLYGWEFEAYGYMKAIMQVLGMAILVAMLSVLISDIVSGECTPATLKFLLVQPIKRGQVLLSKLVTSIVTSLAMVFSLEGLGFALVYIFSDIKAGSYPVNLGKIYEMKINSTGMQEMILKDSGYMATNTELMIKALLLQGLFIITACTVIFMISAVMKSSMVTMGVSVISLVFASILSMIVPQVQKFAHLLFVNYGDPVSILNSSSVLNYSNVNLTVQNGIIVMVVTMIISYIVANIVFTKKDILI